MASGTIARPLNSDLSVRPIRVTGFTTDLNAVLSDPNAIFYYTDSNTLNTPYKQGLTASTNQFVMNLYGNGRYNTQIAFNIGGNGVFYRRRANNSWSVWGVISVDFPS